MENQNMKLLKEINERIEQINKISKAANEAREALSATIQDSIRENLTEADLRRADFVPIGRDIENPSRKLFVNTIDSVDAAWKDAAKCQSLGKLPTRLQLMQIFVEEKSNRLNFDFARDGLSYWTSEEFHSPALGREMASAMDFSTGEIKAHLKNEINHVRLIASIPLKG